MRMESLFRLRKAYARTVEPLCREWDLTRNEIDVLLFLANNPGYDRAADIVERRGIAKSHVSAAVRRLVERKILDRWYAPEDRREVHLRIRPEAMELAALAQRRQQDFYRRIFADFSQEETAVFMGFLDKIDETLKKQEEM